MFITETQQICMKFPKWYSGYKIKKASPTAGCYKASPSGDSPGKLCQAQEVSGACSSPLRSQ